MRHVAEERVGTGGPAITEPVLLILSSLAEAPRHGYALIKDIEQMSSGRVRLSTGTLYGALRRLLESGWIEPYESADTSRDKRFYRITHNGLGILEAEVKRLRELTRIAGARLRVREA